MNDRHVALIRAFYDALGQADFPAMESCYHPEVSFGDPIFQEVEGRNRVMRMWRLQLGMRTGLTSAYREVTADDFSGSARRTVGYTFAATGREVVHEIDTLFRFEAGLIVRHHDDFDFRRWSRMALGRPHGPLFGWTPRWRKTIRDGATRRLDEYEPA
ncbi:nuclear transport factor 2 family protein [Nonomuraea jiangxiensis]|uniref:SnoaL-like domain-containing protein n=1 Tax=Nonomuraea jiangxiensis TaxID=633440 RepID=A0A1G8CTT6_9ACTN|nr:nuclear transport factor 2 family protein [Nonomuraea jiangxiensis]SDH48891.1 SnoaL-like domain-containing protein [Nonomuraea jiangxiensis]